VGFFELAAAGSAAVRGKQTEMLVKIRSASDFMDVTPRARVDADTRNAQRLFKLIVIALTFAQTQWPLVPQLHH